MTNSKTTKRALFSSVVALLLCFTMLLGTTFAWFTDSAASGSNVITAGNLDIVVEYTLDGTTWNDLDGATDLFQKGLWEPGHTEVVVLKITNNGSLALKYAANMNIVNETIGKTKDNKDIVLSEVLTVSTQRQQYINADGTVADKNFAAWAFVGDEGLVGYPTTTTFKAGNVLGNDVMLQPGASHWLAVKVDMAESVGNEANHNGTDIPKINFGINVVATQYTYEKDSFGEDYDKDATTPIYVAAGEKKAQIMGEEATEILESLTAGNDLIVDKDMDLLGFDTNEVDAQGATVTLNGVGPEAYGYLAFLPDAGEDVTVSNLNVTGSGFVEVGHYGIGGGDYTLTNVNITNLAATLANGDKGYILGCAFMAFGDVTLNNCVMTGTTAVQDGVMPVDLGCGQPWSGYTDDDDNNLATTVNGGEYGTVYCWSKSVVVLNGVKVDTLYTAPTNNGSVTIKAGTNVGTININYSNLKHATAENLAKLVIEDGAIVGSIVFNSTTYTVAEWNTYVNSL